MATRKRMEEPMLKSWDEVDATLHKVVDARMALDKIEADMNKKMADIKEKAEDAAKDFREEIKKCELQLKEYTAVNRMELNGKSKELTFGTVGFRLSTKVVLPKVLDKVIDSLKRHKMDDCITVKESVNKDILKTYDDDIILEVGGQLKKEDAFWYDIKLEELRSEA